MGGLEVPHRPPAFYQTEHSLDRSTDSFGILKSAVGDLGYSLATYFLSNQAFLDSSTDMSTAFGILKSAFRDRQNDA